MARFFATSIQGTLEFVKHWIHPCPPRHRYVIVLRKPVPRRCRRRWFLRSHFNKVLSPESISRPLGVGASSKFKKYGRRGKKTVHRNRLHPPGLSILFASSSIFFFVCTLSPARSRELNFPLSARATRRTDGTLLNMVEGSVSHLSSRWNWSPAFPRFPLFKDNPKTINSSLITAGIDSPRRKRSHFHRRTTWLRGHEIDLVSFVWFNDRLPIETFNYKQSNIRVTEQKKWKR